MSHERDGERSYPGPCGPIVNRGRSQSYPDHEVGVDEGEIPPDAYDEAVVTDRETGEMEPEHVEWEERNPC
ncbi:MULTISPECIES: hypothetical protein [Azotobacter]|nr:hypothetical protein [Azotobacter vinelandii]WKN22264.1 hypothetical protein AVAEIV_000223 [Azotobacter vinelandii]GLK58675.1 hypothetical protein GCM10017624_08320 [Azotobacter vinelandii]SFX09159.1 hypothetical protein SAMN04244547_00351 [Azotobacter vinelandii]